MFGQAIKILDSMLRGGLSSANKDHTGRLGKGGSVATSTLFNPSPELKKITEPVLTGMRCADTLKGMILGDVVTLKSSRRL